MVEDDGSLLLPDGRVSFHLNGNPLGVDGAVAQKLWHGFLPAVISTDVQGDVAVGLLAFTARTPWGPAEFVRVRVRLERGGGEPASFTAELRGEGVAPGDATLVVRDGDGVRLAALPCSERSGWSVAGGTGEARLTLDMELSPREPVERWLVFPWDAFPTDGAALGRLDGEDALEGMSQEWESLLTKGVKLELPDEEVHHAAKAAMAQLHLLRVRDADGCWPAAGPEARPGLDLAGGVAQIVALARTGYSDESRESLEYLLSRQRPDGRFESSAGAWDGNGRAAWALMEDFWLTRDLAWLRRVAPALLRSCRWITEAREEGSGLLPAADLEMNGWALHACRLGLEAASYLGEDVAWLEAETDEFRNSVSKAAVAALVAANGSGVSVAGVLHPADLFDRGDPRLREYLERAASSSVDGLPRRPQGAAAAAPGDAADLGG
ncbi:MAG: hypothetical protein AAB368_00410, partial [bacterium]